MFNNVYRFAWFILVGLIVFFDRNNIYWVIASILLLIILAIIAVLRAYDSRNEWRKIIQEENL